METKTEKKPTWYTPGPWHVYNGATGDVVRNAKNHPVVSGFGPPSKRHTANAVLISKAPELLKVVEGFVDVLSVWGEEGPKDTPEYRAAEALLARLRNAVV